ncbi:MAG TPA: HemK/PrmC family methyltransferase, partial [Streptosporangiaceae bacterium]|nr:HemK/PrmC family methyltransferase [Streptosporangiaceae bacterium]
EVVAWLAIEAARASANPLVVDLCTGSGAIALAVADEVPTARVVAVEVDPAAHAWAARNVAATGNRVDLRLGDVADRRLTRDLDGAVDVVAANPPYIPPDGTPVEVEVSLHDPPLALYGGGDDGLSVPREVIAAARRLLRPGGLLVMEHAETQAEAARSLVAGPGWADVHTVLDLAGRPRALVARHAGPAARG